MTMNISDYQSLSLEQQQEFKRQQIEQMDREISQSWQRSSAAVAAAAAPPDPLREKAERELEQDILSAVSNSRFSQVSLAQIARYNSIPIDVVEAIAQQLSSDYLGRDLERLEFESISKQIQKIEAEEEDPGIRDWKLTRLAKRHGTNRRSMMECYNKSLASASMVKAKPIGQFLDEHLQDEIAYLLHGWIPQGITLMLHGDGGAGKTLLAYKLMAAVLKGQAWNGYQCSQSHTLLVQVDEPEIITAERIDIRGIPRSAPLHVLSDWQVEQMISLDLEAAKMPRNSLIIIDSITAINRNCYFSENDTEYARPILQIRDIARKDGHTVILIHHSNADGNARGTRAIHRLKCPLMNISRDPVVIGIAVNLTECPIC
jgi:archaellum biogenesis ATPase FlaH